MPSTILQVWLYPVQDIPAGVDAATEAAEPTPNIVHMYVGSLDERLSGAEEAGVRVTALEAPGHEIDDSRWRCMGAPGPEAEAIERVLRSLDFTLSAEYQENYETGHAGGGGEGEDSDDEGDDGEDEGDDGDGEGDDGDGEGVVNEQGEGNVEGEGEGNAGAE